MRKEDKSMRQDVPVTIVTVSLNSESTIAKTIQAVLNQTYSNIQYFIIDGLSNDKTLVISQSYREAFRDKNIDYQIISESDGGVYDAMNKGIELAEGSLIGMINSDDWYERDAVETAVEAHLQSGQSVIYGIQRIYKGDKLYRIRQNTHHFLSENMCQHPTWFVPASLYRQHGVYDASYKVSGDYELANRFYSAGVSFVRIEKIMANFLLGGLSSQAKEGYEWALVRYRYGHITKKEYIRSIRLKRLKRVIKRLIGHDDRI